MAAEPRKLDDYRLLRELGRGGMGTVHEGLQESTGQRVAVKCLHPEKTRSPRALARFRREAEVLARVRHPVIVPVLEASLEGEQPYIVMPFVDGWSLWEVVKGLMRQEPPASQFCRESLPEFEVASDSGPEEAIGAGHPGWTRAVVRVGKDVAEALAVAHAQGLVHRDLKPGNIMIESSGAARLLDFGLVRDESVHRATLTLSDERVGTPLYMSPEQVTRRHQIDHRSDLYSLAMALVEALTLEAPLQTDDLSDLYRAIAEEDPLAGARAMGGWPPGLIEVLSAALCKNPRDRYQDAGALARDLRRVLDGREPSPPRVPLSRRITLAAGRHGRAALVAGALAVLVWTGAELIGGPPGDTGVERDLELERGRTAALSGDFREAVRHYRGVLREYPGEPAAIDGLRTLAAGLDRRAREHEAAFRYGSAVSDFILLSEIDPDVGTEDRVARLTSDAYRTLGRLAVPLLDMATPVRMRVQALDLLREDIADLSVPGGERERLLLRLLQLENLEPEVTAAVLEVAARFRLEEAATVAGRILADDAQPPAVQVWAAVLLANAGVKEGRERLAQLATERSPEGERALEQLSRLGHPESLPVMLAALGDDDPVRARLAAAGLASTRLRRMDVEARTRTLAAIRERLAQPIELAAGVSLIEAVSTLSEGEGEALLINVLEDPDRPPALRAAAADGLGRSRSNEAVAALLSVLSDPGSDDVVRGAVALVLKPRTQPARTALLAAAERDQDAAVRARALVALGRGRVRAAVVPALKVLSTSQDLRARVGAILSLGLLRAPDDRVVDRLAELLGVGRHPDERMSAAWALGQLDDPAVLPALIDVLEQESARIAARDRVRNVLVGASSGLSALLGQLADVGPLLGHLPELARIEGPTREPAEAVVLAIAQLVRSSGPGRVTEVDRGIRALVTVAREARRPALRAAAVSALGRLPGHREASLAVLRALSETEAARDVRRALALALTRLGDQGVGVRWLEEPLRDGEDALIRALVLIRLGRQAEAHRPFLAAMRLGVLSRTRLDLEPELVVFSRVADALGL